MELAYTTDLKSVAHTGLAGSSPAGATIRTMEKRMKSDMENGDRLFYLLAMAGLASMISCLILL